MTKKITNRPLKKRGAKPKLTEEDFDFVELMTLYADGKTDAEVRKLLGIGSSTLDRYKRKHPKLWCALKVGRHLSTNLVEETLWNKACGNLKVQEVTEYKDAEGNIKMVKTVIRDVPADTTSMIFHLKNRAGDRWRDVQKVDHTVTKTIADLFTTKKAE